MGKGAWRHLIITTFLTSTAASSLIPHSTGCGGTTRVEDRPGTRRLSARPSHSKAIVANESGANNSRKKGLRRGGVEDAQSREGHCVGGGRLPPPRQYAKALVLGPVS